MAVNNNELATKWINDNVVLAEHCDIEYSDLYLKLKTLLDEKDSVISSFEGVAEIIEIDGFDMVGVNGDGVMISTDNTKPNATELIVGKRYEISVKKII